MAWRMIAVVTVLSKLWTVRATRGAGGIGLAGSRATGAAVAGSGAAGSARAGAGPLAGLPGGGWHAAKPRQMSTPNRAQAAPLVITRIASAGRPGLIVPPAAPRGNRRNSRRPAVGNWRRGDKPGVRAIRTFAQRVSLPDGWLSVS